MKNNARIRFDAISQNEAFARLCVSAFIAGANPNLEELSDIKTAVSEAVTNAIVHGYKNSSGEIEMVLNLTKNKLTIQVLDWGIGICDVDEARKPFFTTCTDGTRSGMGITVMESFMDSVKIVSAHEEGTRVVMEKTIMGECNVGQQADE